MPLINWVFCLAWMAVIYYMSDVPNSFHVTEHYLGGFNFFARKWAHMGEYFLLTVLVYRALRAQVAEGSGLGECSGLGCNVGTWSIYCLALGSAIFYALTDEYHQSHVAGRSSSVGDVAVDSAGAMLAIAVLMIKARTSDD